MHTRAWRRTGLTSSIIGAAVLAAACSSGSAASAPTGTPEPAAVSTAPSGSADVPSAEPVGGSITVYNAQHESLTQAWVDEFTKQTGVQVTLRNGDDTELGNLLVQEGDASPADVFLTENSPAIALVEKAGLFAPVDQATLDQVPAAYRPSTGAWTGIAARSTVFAYNPTPARGRRTAGIAARPPGTRLEGSLGGIAGRRRLPGDRQRAAGPRGTARDRGVAGGHEDQLHGLPGQPDRDGRRELGRDPRRGDLPLLLVRRPGQHRREQHEREAALLQERGPGCVRQRLGWRCPRSRARTRLRHRRS